MTENTMISLTFSTYTIKNLAVQPPKTSSVCYPYIRAWFRHINSEICDGSVWFDVDFVQYLVRWNDFGYRVECLHLAYKPFHHLKRRPFVTCKS